MIPEWPELQTIEKKRLPGRRWLLAALAVPAVLIVLAGATWSTLRGLPDKLQRTLHDHGIQLEWGSFRFSSTGYILEEVESSRGIKGTAALTRVDVDFWSLLQGKPRVRSLSVEGFRARTSVQEFTALLSSLRKRRTDQAPSAGSAGESLPDQLRITRGHLTLTNKLNRPLVVLQEVVIRFSRQTGELSLDIDRLPHVVNYELPNVPEDYIHRIGRTGRADQQGQALSFCTEKEEKDLAAIEALMDDQKSVMVGFHNNEIDLVPFRKVIKLKKKRLHFGASFEVFWCCGQVSDQMW